LVNIEHLGRRQMVTRLLVWNPKRWHWWDELSDEFEKRGKKWVGNWSSGTTKSIRPGDRVFLIRLGKEPRGIMGSGVATSATYIGRHWDKELARQGRKASYVDIALDVLRNPGREVILTIETLRAANLGRFNWSPRASGVEIPAQVAARLEDLWRRFLRKPVRVLVTVEPEAVEGLPVEIVTYNRGRSRRLRDAAAAASRGICEVRQLDYSTVLDGKGVRVLHVHHRRQLGATDRPKLTRLSDLAVVCANCHSRIHLDPRRALAVERLRKLLAKRASPG
jgi:5-methylcytosine-specific restriction protein A